MTHERIDYLFTRCFQRLATPEEQQEFLDLLRKPENKDYAAKLIGDAFDQPKETIDVSGSTARAILEAILRSDGRHSSFPVHAAPSQRFSLFRSPWLKYAAALIVLLGAGVYFFLNNDNDKSIAETMQKPVAVQEDIAPGGQKATLTLADGSIILLDSIGKGPLSLQGGVVVEKLDDGQIVYRPADVKSKEILYNTMTTPKGGQYQLKLPDGTAVWLNAASSITYPITFMENTRTVSITGEAYFEVVKDKAKPFIVKTIKDQIVVTGTAFNVNSYADEPVSKTTLVQGEVSINDRALQPGEAYLNGKVIKTDVDQDLAWKNGVFNFDDKKLEEIMRQLSRWYNIDVVYERGIPDMEFFGKMGRDLSLGQVLKALESSGVHFVFEGNRKLLVKP